MALPFDQFVQQMLGGAQEQRPYASPVLPVQAPVQQAAPPPQPVQRPQMPIQQPVQRPQPQAPIMDPMTFAQQRGLLPPNVQQQQASYQPVATTRQVVTPGEFPVMPQVTPTQQPPTGPDQTDLTGTWVTVMYRDQDGKTYVIVMPEAYAQNLPEGAELVPNGQIENDPDRVQIAIDAGEVDLQNPNPGMQRGVLWQMPESIQGIFRSPAQQAQINQQDPAIQEQSVQEQLERQGTWGVPETTMYDPQSGAPQILTVEQIAEQDQDFATQLQEAGVSRVEVITTDGEPRIGRVEFDGTWYIEQDGEWILDPELEQESREPQALTTQMLRNPKEYGYYWPARPELANQLEQAGIFSIPIDQMAVQDQQGNITLVPASETAPDGMEILTYGNVPVNPLDESRQSTIDKFLWVMHQLNRPSYWTYGEVSERFQPERRWVEDSSVPEGGRWEYFYPGIFGLGGGAFAGQVMGSIPGIGQVGHPAYMQWLADNPEAVWVARNEGFTSPDGVEFGPGERAVWERYQDDRNFGERVVDAVTTDPLNLLPTMGTPARFGSRVLRGAARAARVADDAVEVLPAVTRNLDTPIQRAGRSTDDLVTYWDDTQAVTDIPQTVRRSDGTTEIFDTPRPRSTNLTEASLNVSADVLEAAARVLDVPEVLLGQVLDTVVFPALRAGWRATGRIPVSGGRNLSDIITQTRETMRRNATEQQSNAIEDVAGTERTSEQIVPTQEGYLPEPEDSFYRFGNGDEAQRLDDGTWVRYGEADEAGIRTPTARGTWDEIVQNPELPTARAASEADINRTTIPQSLAMPAADARAAARAAATPSRQLSIDRPLDDLGRAPGTTVGAADTLPTDRPIDDLGRAPGEGVPAAQRALSVDEPLRAPEPPQLSTPEQRQTFESQKKVQARARDMENWTDYTRPQTREARAAGEGRIGRDFQMRPQDIAYEAATTLDDGVSRWDRFVRSLNRRAVRYNELESARVRDRGWTDFDDKKTYEMMLEGNHYVDDILPSFTKSFGDAVEVPDYHWKRWGTGDTYHTALDTLDRVGLERMPSNELTEIAMFHGDDQIANRALNLLQDRYAAKHVDGSIIRRHGQNASYDPDIRPELRGRGDDGPAGMGKGLFGVIQSTRRNYLRILEEDAARLGDRIAAPPAPAARAAAPEAPVPDVTPAARTEATAPQPQPPQPETPPARAARPESPVDPELAGEPGSAVFDRAVDPEGAAVYDRAVAASDLDAAIDEMWQTARTPALPARAASVPAGDEAIALPGPRDARQVDFERRQAKLIERVNAFRATRQTPLATHIEAGEGVRGRLADRIARREATREQYLNTRLDRQLLERAGPMARMSQSDLYSFRVRGRAPSETQMRTLGLQFDNGESIVARWDRYVGEELRKQGDRIDLQAAEGAASARTMHDFTLSTLNARELETYNAILKDMRKKKIEGPDGKEIPISEIRAQLDAMDRFVRAGRPERTSMKWWDNFSVALRQMWLYGLPNAIRYIWTQIFGNMASLAVTKQFDSIPSYINPRSAVRSVQTAIRNGDVPNSLLTEATNGYGIRGKRGQIRGDASVRDQTASGLSEQMRFRSIPLVGRLSPIFANKSLRDVAGFWDIHARESLYTTVLDGHLQTARATLRNRMRATKPASMADDEFDALFDSLPFRFSADDVRRTFGFETNRANARWADRHARDWQEAVSKTDKVAADEVKRIFFSGGETNLDILAKRVTFFHYWMSRAAPLYTEAILRDPLYAYNFARMLQSIRESEALGEYGGSRGGFVRWLTSPLGFTSWVTPTGLVHGIWELYNDGGFSPEDEGWLKTAFRRLGMLKHPVMMIPVWSLGLTSEAEMAPRQPFSQQIGVAQSVMDAFGIGTEGGPTPDFFNSLLHEARALITGTLDFIPGIDQIPYRDPNAYRENIARELVYVIALERGLSLDDPMVIQALNDPSSELHQEAIQRMGQQGLFDTFLRITPVGVLYPRSSLPQPRKRSAEIKREREAARELGLAGTARSNELLTERDIIAAQSEESRTLMMQQDQYQSIGSDAARGATNFWYSIRYASAQNPVVIGGRTYTPEALQAMDAGQREALANQWARETGTTEMIEEVVQARREFREENKEYGEYVQWRSQLSDYEGGPLDWWEDVAKGNPNAARWFNDLSDAQRENEVVLTSVDAYLAWSGVQQFSWDDRPLATRTPVDPTPYNPITNSGSGSGSRGQRQRGPTVQSIQEDIAEYQRQMQEYDALVEQYLGQPVNMDGLDPMSRRAIESNMRRDVGVSAPSMSKYLREYLEWAERGGANGDTTVSAFVAWWNQQNPQQPVTETDQSVLSTVA